MGSGYTTSPIQQSNIFSNRKVIMKFEIVNQPFINEWQPFGDRAEFFQQVKDTNELIVSVSNDTKTRYRFNIQNGVFMFTVHDVHVPGLKYHEKEVYSFALGEHKVVSLLQVSQKKAVEACLRQAMAIAEHHFHDIPDLHVKIRGKVFRDAIGKNVKTLIGE